MDRLKNTMTQHDKVLLDLNKIEFKSMSPVGHGIQMPPLDAQNNGPMNVQDGEGMDENNAAQQQNGA